MKNGVKSIQDVYNGASTVNDIDVFESTKFLGLHMWMNMKGFIAEEKATRYTIGISGPTGLMDQQRNTIPIIAGNQTLVKVVPRLVRTTEDFNNLAIHQRNCKLPHETDGFMFLKKYSRIGCEFECAAKQAIQICKCIPWYYSNDFKKWPICEMFKGYCFETIISDETYYRKCTAQCLKDCQETEFIVFWSIVPIDLDLTCNMGGFHHQYFQKNYRKHFAFHNYKTLVNGGSIPDLRTSLNNGSLCKEYIRNFVAFVSVEGPSTKIIATNRDRRIFFYDQLGTFGGTMGLFVGMSVISFFEVGFLLIYLIMAPVKSIFNFASGIASEEPEERESLQTRMQRLELLIEVILRNHDYSTLLNTANDFFHRMLN